MFTIINDYKKLYLLILKSDFGDFCKAGIISKEVSDSNKNNIVTDDLIKYSKKNGVNIDELWEIHHKYLGEIRKINNDPELAKKILKFKQDVARDLLVKGIKLPNNIILLRFFIERFSRMSGIELDSKIRDDIKYYENNGYGNNNKINLGLNSSGKIVFIGERGLPDRSRISNAEFNYSPDMKITNNEKKELELSFIEILKWYKKIGAKALQIKKIQEELNKKGFQLGKIGPNGEFSIETFNALIKFQKNEALKVDGKAGTKTLRKLGLIKLYQTLEEFYVVLRKNKDRKLDKSRKK